MVVIYHSQEFLQLDLLLVLQCSITFLHVLGKKYQNWYVYQQIGIVTNKLVFLVIDTINIGIYDLSNNTINWYNINIFRLLFSWIKRLLLLSRHNSVALPVRGVSADGFSAMLRFFWNKHCIGICNNLIINFICLSPSNLASQKKAYICFLVFLYQFCDQL